MRRVLNDVIVRYNFANEVAVTIQERKSIGTKISWTKIIYDTRVRYSHCMSLNISSNFINDFAKKFTSMN